MKKKVLFILLLIAFIIGLVLLNKYLNNREKNTNRISKEAIENGKTESSVITVTQDSFEDEVLKSDKPVLVDFYANWCPPCKKLSPIVEEVAKENDNVKFVKINIDDTNGLAEKYNISLIPTLLLIKDGEVIEESVGLITKAQVEDLIKN